MSKWTKPELENMLEDVVNALDLSEVAIEEHGPLGTAPAELVRLVLAQKDKQIQMLRAGMVQIPAPTPTGDPQPGPASILDIHGAADKAKAINRQLSDQLEKLAQGKPSPAPAGDPDGIPWTVDDTQRLRRVFTQIGREFYVSDEVPGPHLLSYLREALRWILSHASPPPVQAPAAGPLDALQEIDIILGEHKSAFSRVIEISLAKRIEIIRAALAGAPSAGRPMPMEARASNDQYGATVVLGTGRKDFAVIECTQEEAAELAYRINAFEGAGRPMTWTREATVSLLDVKDAEMLSRLRVSLLKDGFMHPGSGYEMALSRIVARLVPRPGLGDAERVGEAASAEPSSPNSPQAPHLERSDTAPTNNTGEKDAN